MLKHTAIVGTAFVLGATIAVIVFFIIALLTFLFAGFWGAIFGEIVRQILAGVGLLVALFLALLWGSTGFSAWKEFWSP